MNYGSLAHRDDYNRINDILTDMAPGVTNDVGTRYDAVCIVSIDRSYGVLMVCGRCVYRRY